MSKETREREIKRLKDTIELYKRVKIEADSVYENDYMAVSKELKPDELNRNIMYYKAILSVYEYWNEKLGDKDTLMLGKYIGFYMYVYDNGSIRCNLCLEDRETEGKLYDYVFGSHSGINEFFQNHFPDLFSVILGDTGYSYALGSYDLKNVFNFFEHFGYDGNWDFKYLFYQQEKYDKQVEKAKKILDWFFKLSKDTELMSDIDKILTTYFEIVFKYNKED